MSDKLESETSFITWKKWTKDNRKASENCANITKLIEGEDWYYLNCYGLYNKKVIGFTFVISIKYQEKFHKDYKDFLEQLDKNINLNTPMLCIFGIYSPIDLKESKLVVDDLLYVEDILQFTDSSFDYKKEGIKYNKWFDFKVEYLENGNVKEGYEGWYKSAKIRINHITDISSTETAEKYIDELIEAVKLIDAV